MKTKYFIIAFAFLSVVTSCKDEKKTDAVETTEVKPQVKQNFSIEIDVIAEKKDDFSAYYSEDGTNNFTGAQAVWKGVNGGGAKEKVVFDFPEEVMPTNIRLDLGLKKGAEQGDVTVENVKIVYVGKTIEFKGSDFYKFFQENLDIKSEINAGNGTIKFLKNAEGKATPFYYPQQYLLDEIAKIIK